MTIDRFDPPYPAATAGDGAATISRKAQHIDINLHSDVNAKGVTNGFEHYRFVHHALPDLNLADVDLSTEVLGWRLSAPLFISCMTGGVPEAARINAALAEAAQAAGLALGLGSARVLLERPEARDGFGVRRHAPTIPLLGNLGAVQLNRGVSVDDCCRLVELLDADALVLHLNPLQEALQTEGDTCFAGLLRHIAAVTDGLDVPVIVKEVGWGVAPDVVRQLLDAGVAAVDVAGAGGTSWSEVERHRLDDRAGRVAAAFAGWGISTADALTAARHAAPEATLLASGGIRSGGDVALAIALGADMAAAAGPFLRAAETGTGAVYDLIQEWVEVLRVIMFCVGAGDLTQLRSTSRLLRDGLPADRPPTGRAGVTRAHAAPAGAPAGGGATELAEADALCLRLATRHYENFTVASRLLPAATRTHLARIYAYCRWTDDLGDETGEDATSRLLEWRGSVVAALSGGASSNHPVLVALRETFRLRALPLQPFLDLIEANLQDQRVTSYRDWPALEAYCRLSAAPVGRMVLGVVGLSGTAAERLSDDVCIGLQLANHAQDVSVDAARGRTYILQDEILAHGRRGAVRLMCERAAKLLASGEQLERLATTSTIRGQMSLYRRGGLAILDSIRRAGYATDEARPTVATLARVRLAASSARDLTSSRRPPRDAAEDLCARLARREAANFYWGFIALPREQRNAVYALYSFARQVDDTVDRVTPGRAAEELAARRQRLDRALNGDPEDPILRVLAVVAQRHAIPGTELHALIDGVERDLSTTHYPAWPELAEYCRLVAAMIGRMCVRIFGTTDTGALDRADDLGLALQLINILRDVREDYGMGRIYLPADEMVRFGVTEVDVVAGRSTPGWEHLVHFEADRARRLLVSGLEVTRYIPGRAAVCVRTMAGIYSALLEEIDRNPAVPLQRRLSLPARRKLTVLARSCM